MNDLFTPGSLLLLAGILHFTLVPVSASVPVVLDWKRNLAAVSPFNRRIIWVHGIFIVLVIVAFGILTLLTRDAMIARDPTATALAAFIGLFWLSRVVVQLFFYPEEHWPKGRFVLVGRFALTALFSFWSAIYLSVALA